MVLNLGIVTFATFTRYRKIVSSILYIVIIIKVDVYFIIGLFCRYIYNLSDTYMFIAYHCLEYLVNLKYLLLFCGLDIDGLKLAIYLDVAFTDDAINRKLLYGYIITLFSALVI